MERWRWYSFSLNLFELSRYAFITLVLAAIVVVMVGWPVPVHGDSMKPNFHTGEVVIVERISYMNNRAIRRGDVVAARFPADPTGTRLIKRVVGLPGERVESSNGRLFINGQELSESYQPIYGSAPFEEGKSRVLNQDEFFLAGDNRPGSSDSRLWGPVVRDDILGRASFVIFPPKAVRFVSRVQ